MMARQISANQAQYAKSQALARTRSICGGYARYESLKAAWKGLHPDASPSEYEAAVRRIAKECGV